jgi:hypothetical protein
VVLQPRVGSVAFDRVGEGARLPSAVAQGDELPLLVGAVEVLVLADFRAVGGGPFPDVEGFAAVAVDQPDVTVG